MFKLAVVSFLLSLSALSAGCNTVEGAGQDIKAGGNAIENAARDSK